MSNLRLRAIPKSLAAIGLITLGMGAANAAVVPQPGGVYADGVVGGTVGYAVIAPHIFSDSTNAPSVTGYIAVLLKPDQKAWGFALSDSKFPAKDAAAAYLPANSFTLTHSYSTGGNSCTSAFEIGFDATGQTANVTINKAVPGSTKITITSCATGFANQSGQPKSIYESTTATVKTYTLIY